MNPLPDDEVKRLEFVESQANGTRLVDSAGREWTRNDGFWRHGDTELTDSEMADEWPLEVVAEENEAPEDEETVTGGDIVGSTNFDSSPIVDADAEADRFMEELSGMTTDNPDHVEKSNHIDEGDESVENGQDAEDDQSDDNDQDDNSDHIDESDNDGQGEDSDHFVEPVHSGDNDEDGQGEEGDQEPVDKRSQFLLAVAPILDSGLGPRRMLREAQYTAEEHGVELPETMDDLNRLKEEVENQDQEEEARDIVDEEEDDTGEINVVNPFEMPTDVDKEDEGEKASEEGNVDHGGFITKLGQDALKPIDPASKPMDNVGATKTGEKKWYKKPVFVACAVVGGLSLLTGGGLLAWGQIDKSMHLDTPTAKAALAENQKLEDACKPFNDAGLNCEVNEEYSEDKPNFLLVSQSIKPGERVKKGETIKLTYSKGPENGEMEDLSGMTLEEAQKWLADRNLKPGNIKTEKGSDFEDGRVISTSIKPGKTYKNGETVDFVVSAGNLMAPNWKGETKESIIAKATKAGIEVEFKEEESDVAPGTFISSTPKAGQPVVGKKMVVTVAKPKEEAKKKVPDVIGQTQDEASASLVSLGYTKITAVKVKNDEVTETKVTQVVPAVGTEASLSENITIIVSEPTKKQE